MQGWHVRSPIRWKGAKMLLLVLEHAPPAVGGEGPDVDPALSRIVVSGAGCAAVNGVYNRDGDENGKPRFLHTSGGFQLLFDQSAEPSSWVFVSVEDDGLGLYHTDLDVDIGGPLPPRSGWRAYQASQPAPTLRYEYQ